MERGSMPSSCSTPLLGEEACAVEEIRQRLKACLVGLIERVRTGHNKDITRFLRVSEQYSAHFPQGPPGAVASDGGPKRSAGDDSQARACRNAFSLGSLTRVEHRHW